MEDLDTALASIRAIKEKMAALEQLKDAEYEKLLALMKAAGLQKYCWGEGDAVVTALIKRQTKYELVDSSRLLESVSDPMKLAKAVLDSANLTKKTVQALEQSGIPADNFKRKEGNAYLEVSLGAASKGIIEAKSGYYNELEALTQRMSGVAVGKENRVFLAATVFPAEGTPCS
jgi:hypothetical protein